MTPPAPMGALVERIEALRAKADVRGELRMDEKMVMRDDAADLVCIAVASYSRKEVSEYIVALVNAWPQIAAAITRPQPAAGTDLATAECERLASKLEALGDQAATGPWEYDGCVQIVERDSPHMRVLFLPSDHTRYATSKPNARLVTLLRNNLPVIVRALRGER